MPQGAGGPRSLALFFALPTVIVAFFFLYGERTLADVQRQEPNPAVELHIDSFQWQWTFYYLNEGFFVTGKTLTKEAVVAVPVGAPVHVRLEARDVVHEFYVPEFLFMRNALPGRPNEFTFTPTQIGTFRGRCAEFCGLHHDRMTFVLKVMSEPDYIAWVDQTRKQAQKIDCDPSGPLHLVSKDNSWNTNCLAVPAGGPFTVLVTNQDAGIEHNFGVYDTPGRKRTLFQSPRFAGVAEQTFQLQALPKGHYYFECNVHGPAMSGALVVKSVAGQYPRVGHQLAAAGAQLRPAAPGAVQPAGVGPAPARARRGAGMTAVELGPDERAVRETSGPVLGMVLFVASEAMFFATFFGAYFTIYSVNPSWPPARRWSARAAGVRP